MKDTRRLLGRAERSFGGEPPDRVLQRVRAIVGSEGAMASLDEGRLAVRALRKIQRGGEPSPAELASLELLIRMTRPAPLVRQGKPDDLPRPEHRETFPDWGQFQAALAPFAASIGRVDRKSRRARAERAGTCFQLDDTRVLTNRHVLEHLSRGTLRLEKGMGVVRFQQEADAYAHDRPVDILAVEKVHPKLDSCILRITPRPRVRPLAWHSQPPREDTDVVVIGYPAEDSANNPLFIDQIFANRYDVLRAAPGMIVEKYATRFLHDCSTLQGNSGSPVLEMKTARVLGLHVGGTFLWNNEAVAGKSLLEFVKV